jgi:NAD(P) transhydrogenase
LSERYDFAVIGSGPGGQKAAVCAAKAGQRVALIEQARFLGGACVHYGTIPSKALRDLTLRATELRQTAEDLGLPPVPPFEFSQLSDRLDGVVKHYADTVRHQLLRNGIDCIHGRARFVSPHELDVMAPTGKRRTLEASHVVLAVGSSPRCPEGIAIDHENVLDADSILSLAYQPESLAVLGGGVIACEYASIFARLGARVTMIDSSPRPLGFMDRELVDGFVSAMEADGGRVLSERSVQEVAFDGVSRVRIALDAGDRVEAEEVFVALGRVPCVDALDLAAAGLTTTARGNLEVDGDGRTGVSHIFAVGDVAGPPALATSAMEQGRRAVCCALEIAQGRFAKLLPVGVYTIPELASVGQSESDATEALGEVQVGRARFEEVARGQISEAGKGLLKLVADPDGGLLGVHIVGAGATELIHVGQMALAAAARVEDLVENVFNFPTLAEAYRIAALDIVNRGSDKDH